jgi:MtN3 and saliva related transmembrane protein
MHSPLHHFHLRRRARLLRDPYPHYHPSVRMLDNIVLIAGILGPLLTLPQIYKIYVFKEVAGLSFISWFMYAVFNIPWVVYGVVHKAKPILYSQIGWMLTNAFVALGILLYSKNGLF